jgi:hypothetical protein
MVKSSERIPFDVNTLLGQTEAEVIPPFDSTRKGPSQASLPRGHAIPPDSGSIEPESRNHPADVAEDRINPAHYRRHPSGIECIEVTRHMNFNTGNAIKYIWRYLDKGDPVENLKKAQWYLDDEIRRLQGLR